MEQRAIAAPVFGGAVGVDDPGHPTPCSLPRQDAVRPSIKGIGCLAIGKGEEMTEARRRLHRRLGEAMVELAASCTGYVRVEPVVGHASRFVLIESEIEKVADHPAGL